MPRSTSLDMRLPLHAQDSNGRRNRKEGEATATGRNDQPAKTIRPAALPLASIGRDIAACKTRAHQRASLSHREAIRHPVYLGPPLRQFDALHALTFVVLSPPLFAQVFAGQVTYPPILARASPAFSKKGSATTDAKAKNFSIFAPIGLFGSPFNHEMRASPSHLVSRGTPNHSPALHRHCERQVLLTGKR